MEDPESRLADALAAGREVDLEGGELPAAALAAVLTRDAGGRAGVLRVRQARITGVLRLTGARVGVPVDLRGCTFEEAPDLRMAEFAGLALSGCRMPALRGRNLRVSADLALDNGFTADGPVHLVDAQIGGSFWMSAASLHDANERALIADRIVVGGTCYARRLRSQGEVRMPGARITGNFDLSGAELSGRAGDALDLNGLRLGGSLVAGRLHADPGIVFTTRGRVLLAGARISGDLVLAGARIARPDGDVSPAPAFDESRMPIVPAGIVDPGAALVADRIHVEGNVELDDGATVEGTLRLPNAEVGGYVRLSGATLTSPHGQSGRGIALLGDGLQVGGDLEARDNGRGALVCHGQLRLVDAGIRGGAGLAGVELVAPERFALVGNRLRVGGELTLAGARCRGTVLLQNVEIGVTLDCHDAQLVEPCLRDDRTVRPSLDARASSIGKDLLCTGGFRATGGVRIRRMDARKSVQIVGATLGGAPGPVSYSLNAYGLTTTELDLRPAAPPEGRVRLSQARVGTFVDSEAVWAAVGGVQLDGFAYESLNDTHVIDLHKRIELLEGVIDGYAPEPYEQLAAAYRRAGDEERSEQVLIARQRRRYAVAGPAGRIWGALQRWTVGFGYRPWLAVCWLLGFWLAGAIWFALNEPPPIDADQNPAWNPWIFAADTLLPIVNLGQDGYWRLDGVSQWIGSTLVAAGWILATTAAAGAARILKRV